jgi:aryl-alcohol dehydrogenase-like predicted oxidoreductase
MLVRDVAASTLPWCCDHGTGVIVYSPMHSGLLSGRFSRERAQSLPDDDWRRSHPEFNENLDRNLELVERLEPIAAGAGCTLPELAVAWTLAWAGVDGAIVGARRPEQVDGWIGAAELELSAEALQQIADAIDETGAGSGPTAPPRVNVGSRQ